MVSSLLNDLCKTLSELQKEAAQEENGFIVQQQKIQAATDLFKKQVAETQALLKNREDRLLKLQADALKREVELIKKNEIAIKPLQAKIEAAKRSVITLQGQLHSSKGEYQYYAAMPDYKSPQELVLELFTSLGI